MDVGKDLTLEERAENLSNALQSELFLAWDLTKVPQAKRDLIAQMWLTAYADRDICGTVPSFVGRLGLVALASKTEMESWLSNLDLSDQPLADSDASSESHSDSHSQSDGTDRPAETSSDSSIYPFVGVDGNASSADTSVTKAGESSSTTTATANATAKSSSSTPLEIKARQLALFRNIVWDYVSRFEPLFVQFD